MRERLEAVCGEWIRHRAREHADPLSRKAGRGGDEPAPELDSPEAAEIALEFKRRHYAIGWTTRSRPWVARLPAKRSAAQRGGTTSTCCSGIWRTWSSAPRAARPSTSRSSGERSGSLHDLLRGLATDCRPVLPEGWRGEAGALEPCFQLFDLGLERCDLLLEPIDFGAKRHAFLNRVELAFDAAQSSLDTV